MSEPLLKTRCSLHTQHIPAFCSYQEKKLYNTSRLVPPPDSFPFLSISDVFDDVCSGGDETCHDLTLQPQRPNFIINQSLTVTPTLTKFRYDESSTNASDTEMQVFVEVTADHAESLENFETDISSDEMSFHINEIERQESSHPIEFHVRRHNKSTHKTDRPLNATTQQLQVVSPTNEYLITFPQTLETKIPSHVSVSTILFLHKVHVSIEVLVMFPIITIIFSSFFYPLKIG